LATNQLQGILLAQLHLRKYAAPESNNKLQEPLAPSTSAEPSSSDPPLISVPQGSQTQPAIGVPPVVTRLSATPSAQMPLNDYVAPESHRVMLRSLDKMDRSTRNQVALQDLERSMATVIPAQEEFMTISSILQGQWFLFINAQRRGNMRLMRTALLQAVSTQ
jgi:hypothetical protein